MAIRRIDYNPILYNELIETARLAKLGRMEKISFDKSSGLEELLGSALARDLNFLMIMVSTGMIWKIFSKFTRQKEPMLMCIGAGTKAGIWKAKQ